MMNPWETWKKGFAAWEGATLGRQRTIIDTLATVELVGSAPGRKERFDPSRHVRIVWRSEE